MSKTQEIAATAHIKLNAIIAEMEDKANRDVTIIRDLKCVLKQIGKLGRDKEKIDD